MNSRQSNNHGRPAVTGLVLAGGQARRMGGVDKGLVELAGRPLIARVLEILAPQVDQILINANRSQQDYEHYGFPVLADSLAGYHGPLAGIATGLKSCDTPCLVCVPCDSPLLPGDLVPRLQRQLQEHQADIAVAHDGERLQPVFALLRRELLSSLEEFLASGGRKIDQWYAQQKMVSVDFSDQAQAFRNINTETDIETLSTQLANMEQ